MYYTKFTWSDYGFFDGEAVYSYNSILGDKPDCPEYIFVYNWMTGKKEVYLPNEYKKDCDIKDYTQIQYSYKNDYFSLKYDHFNFNNFNKNNVFVCDHFEYSEINFILDMGIKEFIFIEKIISNYKGSGFRALSHIRNQYYGLPIFLITRSPFLNRRRDEWDKEREIENLVTYFEDFGFDDLSKNFENYYRMTKYPLMGMNYR